MPHHSAQKRQMNSFAGAHNPTMMGGVPGISAPPFVPSHGADFRMMPQGHPGQHSPMRGPPHVAMTSWMTSQQMGSNNGSGVVHRVDLHADVSVTDHRHGDNATPQRSIASIGKGDSSSFDSSHEAAASVLLLAASAAMKENAATTSPRSITTTQEAVDDSADETDRNVPLKKRKKAADIMRKKSPEPMAFHVSPHSDNSKHEATTPGESTAGGSPHSVRRASEGSPSSSYDLKDGQALPDSAKITDTKDISPPTHVEIPHFPSVLHAVLTESEFAGKVLQWLPHGQSWKIVRWDALRRQVLPKYFSQLREEDSKDASGSIDAFLWHLSAWGFEEVTDGPDAGAYSHVLFRRELTGLCREMRFAPSEKDNNADASSSMNGDGARTILQVPSLASTTGYPESSGRTSLDNEKKEEFSSSGSKSPGQSHGWPNHEGPSLSGAPSVPYRPENASSGEAWKFSPESSHWMGTPVTTQQRTMPPYSPIRVRSGRGACRLPLNRNAMSNNKDNSNTSSPTSNRPSFPVSNRGKGKGGPGSRANSITIHRTDSGGRTTSIGSAASIARTTSTSSAEAPSPASSKQASAQPRPILKRKLPMMMRKASVDSNATSGSSHAAIATSSSESRNKSPTE